MSDRDREILSQFKPHFEKINQALDGVLESRIPHIVDMGRHSLLGGGKRLRPLLFVLSSRLCGYKGEDLYRLSSIFECIHTASLLHDDVLDNAEVRRRKPSANQLWGNHAAVLEGDFLYSKSFSIAVRGNNLRFLERLTETTTRMAEGQVLELIHTDDWNMKKEAYLEIITAKTAVLISAACACGAIIAGADEATVSALGGFRFEDGHRVSAYGRRLGLHLHPEHFWKACGERPPGGKDHAPFDLRHFKSGRKGKSAP